MVSLSLSLTHTHTYTQQHLRCQGQCHRGNWGGHGCCSFRSPSAKNGDNFKPSSLASPLFAFCHPTNYERRTIEKAVQPPAVCRVFFDSSLTILSTYVASRPIDWIMLSSVSTAMAWFLNSPSWASLDLTHLPVLSNTEIRQLLNSSTYMELLLSMQTLTHSSSH